MLSIINWTPIVYGWLFVMWLVSRSTRTTRPEMGCLEKQERTRPFFAWLVFLPVFVFVVYGVARYDMIGYLSIFRYSVPNIGQAGSYIAYEDEKGFAIFNVLVKLIFGNNSTAYRFSIALLQTIPLVLILRKYSEDYLLAIYVFLAMRMHQAWMMNGIRQFIAVTMIFGATPWIVEKKYVRAFLVVLLAMTFHRSALIMLPVVYVVTKRAWGWQTLVFIMGISIATIVFANSSDSFDAVAETAGYSLDAVRAEGDDGMNPLRVLVHAVPTVLAFFARKELEEEGDPVINVCVNMSILTVGISLVAVVTSGILTGRMPIYTNLYNLILLPRVIRANFHGRNRTIATIAAIGLYYIYYLYG